MVDFDKMRVKPLSDLELRFGELCRPIIEDLHLDLYDLEYVSGSQTLRLFIENEATGTATLDECSLVDRSLTDAIDGADFIGDELTLEVSSPGVYRQLSCGDHFVKSQGQRASILLRQKLSEEFGQGPTKRLIGEIIKFSEEGVTLDPEESKLEVTLPLHLIKKANLEPHWDDVREKQ